MTRTDIIVSDTNKIIIAKGYITQWKNRTMERYEQPQAKKTAVIKPLRTGSTLHYILTKLTFFCISREACAMISAW